MVKFSLDRTSIFLYLVFILFLWDFAYFVGLRNIQRFPHPFTLFSQLGDVQVLRGFARVFLRQTIFAAVAGGIIGIASAFLVLKSTRITAVVLSSLHPGMWLPFFILFATYDPFTLSIAAVAFCTAYYYLAGVFFLGLSSRELRTYVGREAMLQALFISLLSQLRWEGWYWFDFAFPNELERGIGVSIIILLLLCLVNWSFRADFALTAARRAAIMDKEWNISSWKTLVELPLFAVSLVLLWQMLGLRSINVQSSPHGIIEAAYYLLGQNDIYRDIKASLLVVFGGLVLGFCIAVLALAVLSTTQGIARNVMFTVLSALHILPIVLWLFLFFINTWIPDFFGMGQKVILVGFLSFFTITQMLWGLRSHPLASRVLLAIDEALPIAFVAMLFSEMYAATKGIGFAMVVASAGNKTDKALAIFLITAALLAFISATFRSIAKRVYPARSLS
jgi:ABC-type nitrate/sulfonate/bicarbonate transport system permease component